MAGISSRAAGIMQNKDDKFQGQKFDDDLGLNWYQFKWRNHDPQIGRFIEIDPLSEDYVYNSTFAFSENKVTGHVELEGTEAIPFGLITKAATEVATDPNSTKSKVIGAVVGVGKSVEKTGMGVINLVTHPGDAVNGILNSSPEKMALGFAIGVAEKKNAYENGTGFEKSAIISEAVTDVVTIIAGTKGLGAIGKTESAVSKVVGGFADDATVVRGGTNTVEQISKGTATHPSGVTGISVECGTCSVKDLARPLPHNQIGVTTVGAVRNAGGDVIKTSGKSPNHATITGLTPQTASKLLTPTTKNPNKP